tara:strand:- start:555 stop:875 length:321 start_codon:yes stop_codon:yes gene_type:complete
MNYKLFILFFIAIFIQSGFAFNDKCTDCEYLIDFIRYELNIANKTITDISKLLIDICSKIIGPGGKECIVIADDIEKIVKMIADGVNNTNICEALHFCPNIEILQS